MTHMIKPLFELDMSNNKMESIEGCSNLINLVELNLSSNLIENIDLFNQSSSPIQRSRDSNYDSFMTHIEWLILEH